MPACAKEGTDLAALVAIVAPLCQQAQAASLRRGPGRPPNVPDWVLATMILVAVLQHKRTKNAQFTFWCARRELFAQLLPKEALPSRSSFYDRYGRVSQVFREAIRLAGGMAVARGWADANCLAVDQSLVAARGPRPSKRRRRRTQRQRIDSDASWGRSEHDGWVFGYAYEVVVTAPASGVVWPLLSSVDTASRHGTKTLAEKLPELPADNRYYLLGDRGYDSNDLAEAIEWSDPRRRTGRCFLCPEIRRPNVGRPRRNPKESASRRYHRRLRTARRRVLESSRGRRLYARRKVSVEPFHSRFKTLFDLEDRVWHRGLANNRTQILAAVFAYQVLLIYNHERRCYNACVKCILDRL